MNSPGEIDTLCFYSLVVYNYYDYMLLYFVFNLRRTLEFLFIIRKLRGFQ